MWQLVIVHNQIVDFEVWFREFFLFSITFIHLNYTDKNPVSFQQYDFNHYWLVQQLYSHILKLAIVAQSSIAFCIDVLVFIMCLM